jgi:hypothetical protein
MKRTLSILAALILAVGIFAGLGGVVASGNAVASEKEWCYPSEAITWTTGWVLESPGGGWYLVDQRTVVDVEAYDEQVLVEEAYDEVVFDYWQRYSLVGGSWPEGATPSFPNPGEPFRWQANVKGDPHGVGVEGAYDVSNGSSGNSDWFYLEAVEKVIHHEAVYETVHHEAVTHEEYKYSFDDPAVVCPPDPTDPTEPTEPTEPNEPNEPVTGPAINSTIDYVYTCGKTVRVEKSFQDGVLVDTDRDVTLTGEDCSPADLQRNSNWTPTEEGL